MFGSTTAIVCFIFVLLGFEHRALGLVGKDPTTEHHPQPLFMLFYCETESVSPRCPSCPETHAIVQTGFKLVILLFQPSE